MSKGFGGNITEDVKDRKTLLRTQVSTADKDTLLLLLQMSYYKTYNKNLLFNKNNIL